MRGFLKTYFGALFFTPRFFLGAGIASASFVVAFFVPLLLPIAGYLFFAYLLLLLADYFFLFIICRPPRANRVVPSRLSNGDKNPVEINLRNLNRIGLFLTIVDELPVQLQERMFNLHQFFQAWQQHILRYTVRPTTRGEYIFGDIIVFAKTRAGLIERKFALEATQQVTVFPSFVQMNNYQLMSHAGTTAETGTQRKRKIGPVSYTHLDVYKRQIPALLVGSPLIISSPIFIPISLLILRINPFPGFTIILILILPAFI